MPKPNIARRADVLLRKHNLDRGEPSVSTTSRSLVNRNNEVILDAGGCNSAADVLSELGGAPSFNQLAINDVGTTEITVGATVSTLHVSLEAGEYNAALVLLTEGAVAGYLLNVYVELEAGAQQLAIRNATSGGILLWADTNREGSSAVAGLTFVYDGTQWRPSAPNVLIISSGTVDLESGLLAFYRLDETNGNRLSQTATFPLTQVGGVASAAGKIGDAAVFDGVDDYLHNATLGFTGAEGSISVWFKRTGVENFFLVTKHDSTVGKQFVVAIHTDQVHVNINDEYGFGAEVTDNNWHHIVVTIKDSVGKVYFDGALNINIPAAVINLESTAEFAIGTIQDPATELGPEFAQFCAGSIDAVGLWDRELTTGEVAALYAAGAGVEV